MSRRAVIRGVGHGVPERVMHNKEFESIVETSDEWITQRTGIRERRISSDFETASTLGTLAAKEALSRSGVDPASLQMIICGTVTGDMPFPATSCLIQDRIGAKNAGVMDIGAACAGFIYSLSVASAMIESGQIDRALVVGVDTLSKFVDWKDRSTCVLFGDGAGAVVVEAAENTDRGVIKTVLLADGSGAKHICIEAGGSLHPISRLGTDPAKNTIFMAGAEVYRFAVGAMGDACCRALEVAGMDASDIDLFVPHQANLRIIKSSAERLGLPDEKVFVNVDRYGNTSGGSIPLGLYEAETTGRLKPGMVVMTVGFGAGLVWGANLIRW
ncbi:MAG TPA: beta-ketoacyl-ACP synthase III [Fimbriimonadaceae bacterium]|nr:beta-ketoacyl-ACP synthase III [Fimbriimonadaceae bacterium]